LSVTLYNLSPALIVKPIPHTKGRQPKGKRPTPRLPPKHRADCLRQTALPMKPVPRPKAASPKADGQPRAFPQAPGRLPTANSPPGKADTPTQGRQPKGRRPPCGLHPKHRADCLPANSPPADAITSNPRPPRTIPRFEETRKTAVQTRGVSHSAV